MTLQRLLVWICLGVLGCSGCGGEDLVDGFNSDEVAKLKTLGPLPDTPQADTTNKFADNAMAATLGQELFHDKAFSGPIVEDEGSLMGGNGMKGDVGKIACSSCHDGTKFFIDTRSTPPDHETSLGTQYMIRNAGTVVNASYYKIWCEKDGIRDSQWSDDLTDPEDPTSMNGSRLLVATILYKKYKDEFNAIFTDAQLPKELDPMDPNHMRFPDPKVLTDMNGVQTMSGHPGDGDVYDKMPAADQKVLDRIYANFGKAIQAYIRKIVSHNAPIDRYVAGDFSALDDSQKNGLHLFVGKANCIGCHTGPLMSDGKFHNTGLEAKGAHVNPMETGRFDGVTAVLGCQFNSNSEFSDDTHSGRLDGVAQTDDEKGQWRTTQLRSVAETAPYMHTGQFHTLEDVVKFYNDGGSMSGFVGTKDKLAVKLNLSDSEVQDLVNLLKSFTGDPVTPELAKDTSKP